MAFYDTYSSLRVFQRNRSNASLITKDYSGQSGALLTVSTERVSFQTSEGAIVKIDFTMGLYGSPYDYIIHVALIAIPRTSLISSFQPSLVSHVHVGG